jgi:hypothetical protein
MLKLFQSIFGATVSGERYPESLIEAAIERAVDGTDPRIRALSGYRRQLRASVLHAIDHVVALVDSLPAPLAAERAAYSADPRLGALFASAERMLEVFGNDTALADYRDRAGDAGTVLALLLAERVEKNVLGMELTADIVRREVAQTTVSFRGHRLVDPAAGEEDSRRLLRRRAFDHLLSLALERIAEVRTERDELQRQRAVLRHKQQALHRGGWDFGSEQSGAAQTAAVQAELDDIDAQLAAMAAGEDVLQAHLDIVAGVLGKAEQMLWTEDIELRLDRMNIQRAAADDSAQQIAFQELYNSQGRRLVMLFVSLSPGELPRRESFLSAAERYLG